jgi:SET domain-containing protein 6
MIAFTRILLYDTEWERFAKKGKLPKPLVDDAVVEVLGKAIDKRLARYQHDMEVSPERYIGRARLTVSLKSDGERLKADQWRDQHQKRATIVRYGEQRLLHRTKRLLRQAVELPGQKRKADEEGDSGRKKWKQGPCTFFDCSPR